MTVQITSTKAAEAAAVRELKNSPVVRMALNVFGTDGVVVPVVREPGAAVVCSKDQSNEPMKARDLWTNEQVEEQTRREMAVRFCKRLPRRVEDARDQIVTFANKLLTNPNYLLGNKDAEFKAAAEYDVFSQLLTWYEREAAKPGFDQVTWYATLIQEATTRALREAGSSSQSTSPISTYSDRSVTAVWARIAKQDFWY